MLSRRPQKHYQEALTEIFTEIKQKLADGKDVRLTGCGTVKNILLNEYIEPVYRANGQGMTLKIQRKNKVLCIY